jgi:hypothetical protein
MDKAEEARAQTAAIVRNFIGLLRFSIILEQILLCISLIA